jgi:uncharacterized cupin superfamily protein
MSRKIQIEQAPVTRGSTYPSPYDAPCRERLRRKLGDAAGLTQFGVNLTRLPPGAWSSQRHWHATEDELVYVLQGELVLVTDAGEELLRAGDCAGFRAGEPDGHHLQNRGSQEALFLEIGTRLTRDQMQVAYSDIDMRVGQGRYLHRDGTPYAEPKG